MRKELSETLSVNKSAALVIILGSLTWILTMIRSGLPTEWGLGFWGANGHDGIWHVALGNSLARGSLEIPIFAGERLQNYHIGFDLLLALLSKTGISVATWYFQILPIVFALSIGALVYKFVLVLKKSQTAALWSLFFVYFGGSLGWIVTLLRGQGIGGESMFWSQQAVSTLINPPFACSLVLMMLGLVCLQRYFKKPSTGLFSLSVFFFGILIEIKAYAGILALGALFLSALYTLFVNRKGKQGLRMLLLLFFASVVSLLVFLPLNGSASSLLLLQPFWFLETLLALSDRFGWPRLYEAMMNWRSGHVYGKAILGYGVALALFTFGNFGTRILGVLDFRKINKKRLSALDVFMLSVIGGGFAAPLLFVQQGTAWNIIQFFYYSLFFLAIYAGFFMDKLLKGKQKRVRVIISLVVVLLTIPTSLSTLLTVYIPNRPPAKLTTDEHLALTFLSQQEDGVVLTFPYDSFKAKEAIDNPPRPLYLYDSTAYVAAYSNHPVYLEDEVNLTIMGYPSRERRLKAERFYQSGDHDFTRNFLKENNIRYLYWVKPQRAVLGDAQLGLEIIYENKSVIIYKVVK